MSTLYIANCTKQHLDFMYKLPEEGGRIKVQKIPMGGQVIILGQNEAPERLRAIIAQHEQYGLVDVGQIDRMSRFIGICYSFDREIPVERIMQAHYTNEQIITDQGRELRQHSLAALSQSINEQLGDGTQVRNLEVEVIEVGRRDEDGLMRENITVVGDGMEPRRGRKRIN